MVLLSFQRLGHGIKVRVFFAFWTLLVPTAVSPRSDYMYTSHIFLKKAPSIFFVLLIRIAVEILTSNAL